MVPGILHQLSLIQLSETSMLSSADENLTAFAYFKAVSPIRLYVNSWKQVRIDSVFGKATTYFVVCKLKPLSLAYDWCTYEKV